MRWALEIGPNPQWVSGRISKLKIMVIKKIKFPVLICKTAVIKKMKYTVIIYNCNAQFFWKSRKTVGGVCWVFHETWQFFEAFEIPGPVVIWFLNFFKYPESTILWFWFVSSNPNFSHINLCWYLYRYEQLGYEIWY